MARMRATVGLCLHEVSPLQPEVERFEGASILAVPKRPWRGGLHQCVERRSTMAERVGMLLLGVFDGFDDVDRYLSDRKSVV